MTHKPFITFVNSEYDIAMRYADNVQRYETQLPLALSWLTYSGVTNPDELFNDDTERSLLYPSGTNVTLIQIQTTDRYSGVTATLISGQTNLYIQVSEYFSDANPAFIGAPYTVSGESSESDLLLATYTADTPEDPENYWISLPGPGTYKIAFPFPVVGNSITVTHSGSSPYVLSQLLPRKSVQGYDLEVNSIKTYHLSATVIDTVALRVSESIVVGPDLIGAKSIDGSKIIDGTISGVLIRDGTVTGNKVLAGTISGVLLQGETITGDKLVANTITASKIAAGTITFNEIASGTLTADQIADGAVTGRKILDGTISGVLITNDAISASKIQANAITASKIAAGTITSNEIAVSGITAINMAANSITADNISVRTITAEKIVLSGITAELLGAEAVTAAALASGAVISGKIAADSIYASNIVGGQITGYHVAANTITGDRLNVNQLDAVAANMGTLIVNSGISVGTNGYITVPSGYISAGKAKLDSTGLHIGDVASSNLPSITDTLRIAGSGVGGNIVGMALYNGAFHATTPQSVIQLDGTNTLEIENNATYNALINLNFPASGVENSAAVNIYNANLHLRRTPNPPEPNITPGDLVGFDSDGTVRYKLGSNQLLLNNNTADTFTVDASNGNINTFGRIHASGNLHVGPGDHVFTVNGTTGTLHVGPPPHVFKINGASGNTNVAGTLDVVGNTRVEGNLLIGAAPAVAQIVNTTGDISTNGNITSLNNVYGRTVTATTDLFGDATLNVADDGAGDYRFKVSSTGKLTSDAMGYITARRTADVAITTAGTTIIWNNALRSNKITVPTNSSTITITNAGYYMFSATFATVANLTSLRMTLTRGGINYVSTLHGAGLGTGGGFIFNFNVGFFASANSTYTVVLTPSANTTLNANGEGFAGPSPLMNIFQAIGV